MKERVDNRSTLIEFIHQLFLTLLQNDGKLSQTTINLTYKLKKENHILLIFHLVNDSESYDDLLVYPLQKASKVEKLWNIENDGRHEDWRQIAKEDADTALSEWINGPVNQSDTALSLMGRT